MAAQNDTEYEEDVRSLEQRVFARQHRSPREPLTPWVYSDDKPSRAQALRNLPRKIRGYFS